MCSVDAVRRSIYVVQGAYDGRSHVAKVGNANVSRPFPCGLTCFVHKAA